MVTPSKRQSAGKQGSGTRSRSSSDERKNSAKSPPGSPSLHYQVSYTGELLTVTILECKVRLCAALGMNQSWIELYGFAVALVIVYSEFFLCFDDEIAGQIIAVYPRT